MSEKLRIGHLAASAHFPGKPVSRHLRARLHNDLNQGEWVLIRAPRGAILASIRA